MKVLVTQSCLTLRAHGLQPSRLLCPWDSPGKNTGVGSLSLLQGSFPTQGLNPGLPHWQADSLPSEPPGRQEGMTRSKQYSDSDVKTIFMGSHRTSLVVQGLRLSLPAQGVKARSLDGEPRSPVPRGQKESESEVAQSCPTLCDAMDYSPPSSSFHGILQARILEWVAISFSKGQKTRA